MKTPDRMVREGARELARQVIRAFEQGARLLTDRRSEPEGGRAPTASGGLGSPSSAFAAEVDMLPQLQVAAKALWPDQEPNETWVFLEEQLLHSRIADLVLIRLDVDAVRTRLDGGWARPLRLQELRTLRALRHDRAASLSVVAGEVRMARESAASVLRRLVADGFALREPGGGYRRLAPSRPLAQRVVTFEAKRDNPRGALEQARGHRLWADETYVAFDATYRRRFEAISDRYRHLGVGLIELTPTNWNRILRSRAERRSDRLEKGLMGERALGRLIGAPMADRPERRLAHGHRLSSESDPIVVGRETQLLDEIQDQTSRY